MRPPVLRLASRQAGIDNEHPGYLLGLLCKSGCASASATNMRVPHRLHPTRVTPAAVFATSSAKQLGPRCPVHVLLLLRQLVSQSQRKQQAEAAALALPAPLQPRNALVLSGQVPHQRQAQPSAALLLVSRCIDLLEGLEQLLRVRFRYPRPLINDPDENGQAGLQPTGPARCTRILAELPSLLLDRIFGQILLLLLGFACLRGHLARLLRAATGAAQHREQAACPAQVRRAVFVIVGLLNI